MSPFFSQSASAAEPLLEKTILFTERSNGFTHFRIPGIVVTTKGAVLAYCEARKFRDADRGEIAIHLRRSTDGGRTFSPAKQIARLGPRLPRKPHMPEEKKGRDMGGPDQRTVNNPVAIATRGGTMHLIYCVDYMRAFHLLCGDGATNWSKPVFARELLEPGRMAGITAHPGTATMSSPLFIFSNPHTTARARAACHDLTIHLNRDHGQTWPLSKTSQPGTSAYSDLAVLPDGAILCFCESGTNTPKIKRKRDWAYSNLALARFNLEWLTQP